MLDDANSLHTNLDKASLQPRPVPVVSMYDLDYMYPTPS